ncbi:MAG TPA: prepilin-type N-terminal cleavage/methylation domain-containing protein [Nitrospirota bacterium]|nr:prepilin-type N-terminal cleavage/methylation domain-containing protein [Nitrospirota bacterium]
MMKSRGFTLIELIMVLVLIGIVAVFAAPRLGDVTTMKSGAFADKVRADMRYAQTLAMTGNRRTRTYFNGVGAAPAQGYSAVRDSSAAGNCASFSAVIDPASSGNLTVTVNTGTYAGITLAPAISCLEFDSFGRPYDCSANLGICSSSPLAASVNVAVLGSGVAIGAVTITAETGAVN